MNENGSSIRLGIFGAGSLVEKWIRQVANDTELEICIVVQTSEHPSARTQKIAQSNNIPIVHQQRINDAAFVATIESLNLDFIISADNFKIFGDRLLSVPRKACINFHNGPLEKYRGLNIPTWVIWNDETTHTVVWHTMLKELDAGLVVEAGSFQLDPGETAFSLTVKMIENGAKRIPSLCEKIKHWDSQCSTFSACAISEDSPYYRGSKLPNQGNINLDWSSAGIERFIRAFSYSPLPLLVGLPKIKIGNGFFTVKKITNINATIIGDPGIVAHKDNEVTARCKDALIAFEVSQDLSVSDLSE